MLKVIGIALVAFASTNLDDLFLGMLCFAAAQTRKARIAVVLGKYLGIGVLIGVSLFAAIGLRVFIERYLWFLGLVPILLGIRAIFAKEEEMRSAIGVIPTALLTVGSGADNIGVYLPLFAGMDGMQTAVTVGIFFLMTGVWSALSCKITDLPAVQKMLKRHRNWIIPTVYLLLGGYVLLEGWI